MTGSPATGRLNAGGQNPTLRPMAASDLEQVVALEAATFPEPWSRVSFRTGLTMRECLSLVAELQGEVVGYLIGVGTDEFHIANVAVAPGFRRQGIGTMLMQAGADHGRRVGAKSVRLEVRRSNSGAHEFYRRLGFIQTYVRKGFYGDGEDAIVMERDL